jgi:hypothetical protein
VNGRQRSAAARTYRRRVLRAPPPPPEPTPLLELGMPTAAARKIVHPHHRRSCPRPAGVGDMRCAVSLSGLPSSATLKGS